MSSNLFRLTFFALASFVLSYPLAAQVPVQVADLNTTRYDNGDSPLFRSEFVEFGGAVYFTASDVIHGLELWKTDGTEGGTVRITDLCPGACDSFPRNLTVVGASIFFSADDGAHGLEPWITDGTTAGTRMILDAVPGLGGSAPNFFRVLGGRVFYSAQDPSAGRELWVTDGTPGGTGRWLDIQPGPSDSWPTLWQVVGTDLFFAADDGVHGEELWATDGTAAGTRMVRDIFAGATPSLLSFTPLPGFARFAKLGSRIFFAAADATNDYELWASDGTAAGTTRVADIHPGSDGSLPTYFEPLGSILLFKAGDGTSGAELWRTDGTEAGTVEVKDILPGASGSDPYELTRFGNSVYFHADDQTHGRELWRSDGTAAGTTLVADLRPGIDSGLPLFWSPHSLTPVGSRLLFFADDGVSGNEPWATDGTAAGTAQVADINPGPAHADGGSFIGGFEFRVVSGGRWFFTAYDGSYLEGHHLYASDGTAAGTARIKRLADQRSGVTLPNFGRALDKGSTTALANRLIFLGDDGIQGAEPAASDGTPAGTAPLLDVNPGPDTSAPGEMITLGSRALFSASESPGNRTLYATDGTSIGTAPLSPPIGPYGLTAFLGSAYFSAFDTVHGTEIWKSDGTPGGTGIAFDLVPGSGGSSPALFTPLGDKLLFSALEPAAGNELWVTDGATAQRVADIQPGPGDGFPNQLTPAPNYSTGPAIFFAADDGTNGRELWISDGTAAGTHLVRDLAPGPASSIEAFPTDSLASESGATMATLSNSLVVFAAADTPGDEELWASGGGPFPFQTFRLAEIHIGREGSQPRQLTKVGPRVVFVADDGVHGRELWVVKNLLTERLADIFPGPASSVPQHLTGLGGIVLFSADDGTHGREPWVTDGTPEGTRRLADIAPGALPSSPYDFTAVGSDLYFAATDAVSGFELWRVPRSSLGAHVTATKQVSGQFVPGGLVAYTIVLSNAGPGAQLGNSGLQLEDPISPALALESVTATSGTITHAVPGPQINWSGEIPAGGQVTITIVCRVLAGTPPGTVIANQATVHFDSDGDLVDDTSVSTDDPGLPGGQDGTTFRVGLGYYTVPPCRTFDSRKGSPLSNGSTQTIPITGGVCAIPATAKAVAFNITAITPSGAGFLRAYPSASTPTQVSQVNFGPDQTRTNNGILEIGADGQIVVDAALTAGAVDFVFDVVGYFE